MEVREILPSNTSAYAKSLIYVKFTWYYVLN